MSRSNPEFPLYIPSKGRFKFPLRLTSRALEAIQVPYRIIVEEKEYKDYAAVIDPKKILVLDPAYQRAYDACDSLGMTKSKGPGPARNFAWDHSLSLGAPFHWVMDDNIRGWYYYNHNKKVPAGDGTFFRCMEDFVLRYTNVAMAGPNYDFFVPARVLHPPFVTNTRIYSCNLIRNDIPLRWRGRYNEDTDLSLRMLKSGWATIQFNAFLQKKTWTQALAGGNTAEFYAKEGTMAKSQMQVALHPDVSRLVHRFQRWHHYVDYSGFKNNPPLRRREDATRSAPGQYALKIITVPKPTAGIHP